MSFPAMIGSDNCIVVFFNVIFIKKRLLEFSFYQSRSAIQKVVAVAFKERLMKPRVLAAAMDPFVYTEEDYCQKGMHFAIYIGRENIILCTKSLLFNVRALYTRF